MKKIFNKLVPLGFIMLAFVACKKDEVQTIVKTTGDAGTLSVTADNVVLDKSMLDKNVVTFNLTEANFGYDAAVNNVLQVAVKGTDFSSPKEVILDAQATTKTFNGLDFNNLLLSLSLPTTSSSDVEVRIKSAVSPDIVPVYSNVVSMKAKPFPLTAFIYVPGAYQGWDPATADSLISLTGNGIYVGIIPFDGGNFKITPQKKWDVAYGDAGGGKISTTGGDISSGSAGAKQLTVDLNANTIAIKDVLWSVVGSATKGDWSPVRGTADESDMTYEYVKDGDGKWKVTLTLTDGEIKFRKDYDWGTSFGGDGKGNLTGDNIKVTAGTYTITLDIPNNKYTLVKN